MHEKALKLVAEMEEQYHSRSHQNPAKILFLIDADQAAFPKAFRISRDLLDGTFRSFYYPFTYMGAGAKELFRLLTLFSLALLFYISIWGVSNPPVAEEMNHAPGAYKYLAQYIPPVFLAVAVFLVRPLDLLCWPRINDGDVKFAKDLIIKDAFWEERRWKALQEIMKSYEKKADDRIRILYGFVISAWTFWFSQIWAYHSSFSSTIFTKDHIHIGLIVTAVIFGFSASIFGYRKISERVFRSILMAILELESSK